MLFSKAHTIGNIVLTVSLLITLSCTVPQPSTSEPDGESNPFLQENFVLAQQKAPPEYIQSIQLHPKGQPNMPPIITLNSSQQLYLSFDYLREQNQQFRIKVSHRNKNWQKSALSPSFYLEGFSYSYIQQSKQSLTEDPTYQHVCYAFPNNQLRPKISGNYLLEIYDYSGNKLLFSMPFFITEDKGMLKSRVETLFARHKDGRSLAQLFSSFGYPNFVEFPQFDLSISYVQNRFWGRSRTAEFLTSVNPGQLTGHISRQDAFIGDYEFKLLDVRDFDADGRQIIEVQPDLGPPNIFLRRDIQRLNTNPRFFSNKDLPQPLNRRNNRYALVHFSLETDNTISTDQNIYLVGEFNNWFVSERHKMKFDKTEGLWKGEALIKQGKYAYKYIIRSPDGIDDLRLDQNFQSPQQEYLTFIYFKDLDKKFDRILKIDRKIQ